MVLNIIDLHQLVTVFFTIIKAFPLPGNSLWNIETSCLNDRSLSSVIQKSVVLQPLSKNFKVCKLVIWEVQMTMCRIVLSAPRKRFCPFLRSVFQRRIIIFKLYASCLHVKSIQLLLILVYFPLTGEIDTFTWNISLIIYRVSHQYLNVS